ncbi:MAG TPA: hypothetical protein DCM28_04220 [Phycisphaerales bacterium]|nr:hypothetical protein [Phycisphaerales bacterium]|tara:strand:- start:140794 stop:141852 length:1059 start_codon:yes stop_codon:yes gene_type:complete
MNLAAIFPFDYPLPTAFYLFWYVLTLVIHVVFMNYVLGGITYLGLSTLAGRPNRNQLALMLRDWMPFAIGVAITAGVAPLLFIQILYQKAFYTANLLLFHRWMIILPILIVGFYLAYLLKTKMVANWPYIVRVLLGLASFACFAFIAYSWTENYLLSMETQQQWSEFYGSDAIVYQNKAILPRLGVWFLGAFATMSMLVGWQLWYKGQHQNVKLVSIIAIVGLLASGACGFVYKGMVSDHFPSGPFLYIGIACGGVQLLLWLAQLTRPKFSGMLLSLLSVFCPLAIIAMTVVREKVRLAAIDLEPLYPLHKQAMGIAGIVCFLFFFILNAGLILYCFRLVKKNWIGGELDTE